MSKYSVGVADRHRRAYKRLLGYADQGITDPVPCSSSSSTSTCRRISVHTQSVHIQRHLEEELARLDQDGMVLSREQYLSLLRACNKCKSLPLAQRLHSHFTNQRLDTTSFLGENLLVTLAKCGALENAIRVFQGLPFRTTFGWTAIISGLTDWGQPHTAIAMYQDMVDEGIEPDSYTFVSLFKACGMVQNLEAGKKLHLDACQMCLTNELLVTNTLISMYCKCQAIGEAETVFSESLDRDAVTWNAMMSVYLEEEQSEKGLRLYRQMCEESVSLRDENTMVIVLQVLRICAEDEEAQFPNCSRAIAFEIGRALHSELYHKELSSTTVIGNTLISMYGSCRMMEHARNAFHGLIMPDIVSKTAVLSACVQQGQAENALHLYCRISQEEVASNHQTFLAVFKACGNLAEKEEACEQKNGETIKEISLEIGQAIHVDARARDAHTFLAVANSILTMYRKCGAVMKAEAVFEKLIHMDMVSWNTMICAYVENGKAKHALRLYRQMCEEGFEPNRETFLAIFQACDDMAIRFARDSKGHEKEASVTNSCPPEIGIALHADVKKRGFASDIFVGTTLISMYGKYGSLAEAENVFCSLCLVDLVSCTAILSAFIEQGEDEMAFSLYIKMQEEGIPLDGITINYVLQISWETGRQDIVRYLDFVVVSGCIDSNSLLESVALIQAYGSPGSTRDAKAVFDVLPNPDLAAWNACTAAITCDIPERACFQIVEQMQFECFFPDASTFTSVLSACTYEGLSEAGVSYFESMTGNVGLCGDVNHFVLMTDLLGRAGDLGKAKNFVKRVPKQAELSSWLCLLSACRIHGNTELGKLAFDHVVYLQTEDPSAYVLMSNMCVDVAL